MGRLPRPNIPGATYHVMNRGNRKAAIFEDERDRRRFLQISQEQQRTYGVKMLGGCLMHNHFHLTVNTPNGNLSEFMQQLEGGFARYSNWRHHRVGHLFQGRFRHVHIESDVHLLTALCYVFLNPVAARLVTTPEAYRWSTYAASTGFRPVPEYLNLEWLESLYPALSLGDAQQRFRALMANPAPVAAYLEDHELSLPIESINQVVESYTGKQLRLASLPRMYRTALRPPLQALRDTIKIPRVFAREARLAYGYKVAEIANALGLAPSTVSLLLRKRQRRRT